MSGKREKYVKKKNGTKRERKMDRNKREEIKKCSKKCLEWGGPGRRWRERKARNSPYVVVPQVAATPKSPCLKVTKLTLTVNRVSLYGILPFTCQITRQFI